MLFRLKELRRPADAACVSQTRTSGNLRVAAWSHEPLDPLMRVRRLARPPRSSALRAENSHQAVRGRERKMRAVQVASIGAALPFRSFPLSTLQPSPSPRLPAIRASATAVEGSARSLRFIARSRSSCDSDTTSAIPAHAGMPEPAKDWSEPRTLRASIKRRWLRVQAQSVLPGGLKSTNICVIRE
jgi:hypothetical protein